MGDDSESVFSPLADPFVALDTSDYRNSDIATRDINDIQTDIDQIAKLDIGGLDSAIRNGVNSNTRLKGLDREVEITTDLMDDNDNVVVKDMSVDGDDGMSADIPGEGNPRIRSRH